MSKLSGYTSIILITILFLFVGFVITNCTSDSDSQSQDLSEVERVSIDSLDLFLNPVDHNLSRPLAMEVLSDGRISILDSDQKKVLIYQSDGTRVKQFGREGKGPGEFVQPRGLELQDSTLHIIDLGLQRVNQYDLSGNFIKNYSIKREASFFGATAIGDSMEYYTVANGLEGKLIGHRNAKTDSVRYFGKAVVEDPPPVNNRNAFKDAIANDEVPEAVRNDLIMDYSGNHLYAYLKAESRLQKYRDGSLIWDKEVALPINKIIFENFVEEVQQSPSAFGILRYVDAMFATDNNIYLLWNGTSEKSQQVVQVSSDGEVTNIYQLSDNKNITFDSIAVNERRNQLYLGDQTSAEVYTTLLSK